MEKRGRVKLRPEHSGCVLPDKNDVVFNSRSSFCMLFYRSFLFVTCFLSSWIFHRIRAAVLVYLNFSCGLIITVKLCIDSFTLSREKNVSLKNGFVMYTCGE